MIGARVAARTFVVAACAFVAACSSKATGDKGSSGGTSSGTSGTVGSPGDGTSGGTSGTVGSSGASGTSGTSGAPGDCGNLLLFPFNASCQAKVDAVCCAQEKACSGASDFDCEATASCANTCRHDQSCIEQCISNHPSGAADFGNLVSCTSSNVSGDCQWP